jgi:hypothetical protein
MLCFFRVAQKIGLGSQRLLALDTVIRRRCRHTTMPRDMGSLLVSMALQIANEFSLAASDLAAIGAMVEPLPMEVLVV